MAHTHDHDHPHDPIEHGGKPGEYEFLAEAMRQLLIEKNVFTADELRGQIDKMDSRSPALGARMVARAWTDPAYKKRLLADGGAAAEELLGISVAPLRLIAVENTDMLRRGIESLPPDAYERMSYYERWIHSITTMMLERGVVTRAELDARVARLRREAAR